ncbi:MAG: SufD family Fe-S cluster assembly protein [Candidatus Dojkabacteria bacterium]
MKQIILDLTKPNQTFEITEDTEFLGLFVGRNSEQVETVLNVIHKNPELKSLTKIKAVVYDRANFDMEGKLIIETGARNTDSYLSIDVLLMGPDATARAVPSLEITEDDVKGGHGATVGQVDGDQLFYLQSRGLTHDQAERLLVEGFVQDFLRNVKSKQELAKFKKML